MSFLHLFLVVLLVLMWSSDFVGAKYLTDSYPVFALMTVKFALCALLVLPFQPKSPLPLRHLLAMSYIYAIAHIGAWMVAVKWGIRLSTLSFIEVLATPLSILLGIVFLREKMSATALIGTAIAFFGTTLVIMHSNDSDSTLQVTEAIIAALVSTTAWAVYNSYVGTISKRYDVNYIALVGWMALFGCLFSGITSIIFERGELHSFENIDSLGMAIIAYNAIATLIFHTILLFLLRYHAVSKLSMFLLLTPFVSSMLAYFLFHEPLETSLIIGGAIICTGVIVAIAGGYTPKSLDPVA